MSAETLPEPKLYPYTTDTEARLRLLEKYVDTLAKYVDEVTPLVVELAQRVKALEKQAGVTA